MKIFFYFLCFISVVTSITTIVNTSPMRSLLYLIFTIILISIILFLLGAEFAGSMEIIIYAGAIMILFVFVLMLLNTNANEKYQIENCSNFLLFVAPIILIMILFILIAYSLFNLNNHHVYVNNTIIDSKKIGIKLFSQYLMIVELVSMLLLSSLIVTFHIGRNH